MNNTSNNTNNNTIIYSKITKLYFSRIHARLCSGNSTLSAQ